ncbi:MAG: CcmD family protein [Chitinophagaceae bacterium]
MQKIITLLMLLTISLSTFAQTEQPQMADAMRSNGKIYVVVVVCLLILFGLIGYVFRIDRKLTKLEQKKD